MELNQNSTIGLRFIKSRLRRINYRRVLTFAITIPVLALVALVIFFTQSYRSYARLVDSRLAHGYLHSRAGIYAGPRTLRTGQRYTPVELAAALRRAGYVDGDM